MGKPLTAEQRGRMPAKEFAGPNHSFPIEDKKHARLAISGATRSERAGNISAAEEARIKAKARRKLGRGDPKQNAAAAAELSARLDRRDA